MKHKYFLLMDLKDNLIFNLKDK